MKYYFTGKVKWAKVSGTPENEVFEYKGKKISKPAAWSLNLYMDEKSTQAFNKSGSQLKVREDDDGEFVEFRRPLMGKDKEGNDIKRDPPRILNSDGEVIETLIGNGSEVTVSVEIFPTRMGNSTRLEAIRIENLVEYNPNGVSKDTPIEVPF